MSSPTVIRHKNINTGFVIVVTYVDIVTYLNNLRSEFGPFTTAVQEYDTQNSAGVTVMRSSHIYTKESDAIRFFEETYL